MSGKVHAVRSRSARFAVGALLAGVAAAGCSNTVTGTAERALTGTYTLVSANGAPTSRPTPTSYSTG